MEFKKFIWLLKSCMWYIYINCKKDSVKVNMTKKERFKDMSRERKKIVIVSIVFIALFVFPSYESEFVFSEGVKMEGMASWYSEMDPGIRETTANMEIFDDKQYTCAIWNVPFNSMIKVTNINNGKSVTVRVNDRGPAKRFSRSGRIIDLTKKAFSQIAPVKKGLITVEITILPSS